MKDYTKVCSPEDFVRPSSGVSLLRGATNEIAARMGGKQTHLAEKRSAVPAWSTRALSQRVSLISCPCLRAFQSCCSSSATASKPGKQSIEIRSLSRSTYHHRSISDNQVGDLASKSEGAHIDTVLFEFTEKRCMNEASAIWDLKGIIATISVVMCPGRRIQ
ncbi:hypothetical protein IVB22_27165 [Bradyrhizobium sp. 190]|uniref:hypothetical protein n=1 Tax=Bradyrhizobium sp. 190 TaxID=2782658 RepID=UPI001FF90F0B|nr:hypothetical protein [Bradyrhizobium sp. 190]MCK1516153.1 hypothetical protein [Bradyrhizobium sp. 190]